MNNAKKTTEFLLTQCERYPALCAADLLKGLHQSVFGCGHFVTDAAAEYLREELAALPAQAGESVEELDGDFCRIHLRAVQRGELSEKKLLRLFRLSAEKTCGSMALLEEKLAVLTELSRAGKLPFSAEEVTAVVENWKQAGFPACHHSEAFREAYRPAYRVVAREYVRLLPLLGKIDALLEKQERVIVALEGGSAAGKTTLAQQLRHIYGCTVFHMDDFFLRPHQRTAERLAEPGGNVDRERFYEEVLRPLVENRSVTYRRYDCQCGELLTPVTVEPTRLTVVEGAYSMHPQLAGCYDLSAFLRISPQLQRSRILKRNGADMAQRFFNTWIPMEQAYFEAMNTAQRCDLILEVDE